MQKIDGQKLKNLLSDLKVQDKDEITLKKIKADGQDKDGLKEAQIRKQLIAILNKYGLNDFYKTSDDLEHNWSETSADKYSDNYIQKQIFKDKKLDKLWKKAQNSGLNDEELKILKEEFRHHELKIEEYDQLINDINRKEEQNRAKGEDWDNSMNRILNEEEVETNDNSDSHQALKDKHFEIKQNYKRLNERIVDSVGGLKNANDEFEEESVQKLWQLALKSNFDREELMSLRDELDHYQNRIKKLRHFEAQLEMDSIAGKDINENFETEFDGDKHIKRRVKELNHNVNKLHNELETRIMQRHIEL